MGQKVALLYVTAMSKVCCSEPHHNYSNWGESDVDYSGDTDMDPPPIRPADLGKLKSHLQQGDRSLAEALAGERNPGKVSRLEVAQAAVRDALRWADESGDCAIILVALEEVWVGDLSPIAARHVEAARDLCRP